MFRVLVYAIIFVAVAVFSATVSYVVLLPQSARAPVVARAPSVPETRERAKPAPAPLHTLPLDPVAVLLPKVAKDPVVQKLVMVAALESIAPEPKAIIDIPVNLRTVVVLRCSFVNSATGARLKAYGSGAIVSREGHILTARHVVDMAYAYAITSGKQGVKGYQFESCEVGQPPEGARTPTPQEIRAINPFTAINFLPYRAQIAFIPDETKMSETEKQFIDIALLRIAGVTDDVKTFFNVSMPHSFEFNSFIVDRFPAPGDEVLTFGFPSGAPSYGSNFYLQGSVGETQEIIGGDQQFKNQPIGITAFMETIGGRSGSPVFWHGAIVGVVSAREDYTRNTTAISVYPLFQMIQEKGISL